MQRVRFMRNTDEIPLRYFGLYCALKTVGDISSMS